MERPDPVFEIVNGIIDRVGERMERLAQKTRPPLKLVAPEEREGANRDPVDGLGRLPSASSRSSDARGDS